MLKHKSTVGLITASVVISATALAMTARQKTERASTPDYRQRVENSNPNFRPIMTMEDQNSLDPLGMNQLLPTVPGLLSLAKSAPAREAASDVPEIYGCVIASRENAAGVKHGVAMWSFKDDVFTQKNSGTKATQAQGSGAPVGANYYAIRRTGTGKLYVDRFTISNWSRAAATSVSNDGLRASDVAYDPTSDIVYGCFYNDNVTGYVFGKVDYATRVRTAIKPLDMQWNAVMADRDGQIYAIDMNGDLLKVDKTTGDYTVVGNTGVVPAYQTSATIDLSTGRCFWNAMPATAVSSLYEVDLTTGVATKLYDFACNDEITGMFIPTAATPADAPKAVTDLAADFTDNSLTGTVSFTAPVQNTGGSAGTGKLTYRIWSNGVLRKTAECDYGEAVSVPLTMETGDKYYIVVAVENAAGRSPIARIARYVGNDTPKAPVPSITRDGEEFVISWPKVTTSVNNGYINPDQLTYTVRRFPDDVVVYENTPDTVVRDMVPETYGQMIPYKYTVTATFEDKTGAAGTTPLYPLGTIIPPYYEGFDDAESLNNFIILDSNGDGTKWIYSGSMSSAYITNSSIAHDDWLITAGIYLSAGKTYTFSYEAMASFYDERIEIKMGTAATAEAMTRELLPPTDLPGDFSLKPNPVELTVEESGVYYIGFHAISDPDAFYLYLDNISISCEDGPQADATEPPYKQEFTKSSVLSTFTVIDGNNDGYIWNIDRGEARVGHDYRVNADDWMISPPFIMKKGAHYNVRLKARTAMEGVPEKFDVRIGTDNKADAMTTEVMPVTTVTEPTATLYEKLITVPEDGIYFVGVHGCSDAGSFELYIDDFEVAAPVYDNAPGLPTEGKAEGADFGDLKATVSFTAPSKTVSGDALASISKIEAVRDGAVVHTFDNPTPGSALTFDDEVDRRGDHTWVVTAFNDNGAGLPLYIEGYVGVGVPEPPTDVKFVEEGNTGKITLSWTAPTLDVLGHKLNPEAVTYMIVEIINGQQLLLAQNVTTTSYVLQASGADTQAFKTYGIFPVTAAGTGRGTASESRPVGKPDTAPWAESAPDGRLSNLLGTSVLYPEAQWQMANDGSLGMFSCDEDNGFFMMQGGNLNAAAAICTGKIDLSSLTRPALSFYTYNIEGQYPDTNMFVIQASVDGSDFETIAEYVIDEVCPEYGWNLIRADLSSVAGKTAVLRIVGVTMGYLYTFVDNIRIDNADAIDLEAPVISAPTGAVPGVAVPVAVKVRNIGVEKAENTDVVLYLDDTEVARKAIEAIEPMEVNKVSFDHLFTALDKPASYNFHAAVEQADDQVADNNTTETVTVTLAESELPAVRELAGAFEGETETVSLEWEAPIWDSDFATTEGFEKAEPFTSDIDGWTAIDVDGLNTYGFSGITFPGAGAPKSFIVFDDTYEGFGNQDVFLAYEGHKYVVSMASPEGANDDWLISPELCGEAQTVSFYAKTYTAEYGLETFEVLASSTGNAPDDFTIVGESHEAPAAWTEFKVEVPENTRYVAIRCTSNDKFIFMLDNITVRTLADIDGPALKGYNVYREGTAVNDNVIADTRHSDNPAWEEGKAIEYAVTAVYSTGESKAARVNVVTSGVDTPLAANFRVYAEAGAIVIESSEEIPVTIATTDGKTVYNGRSNGTLRVAADAGLYVVKAGGFKATLKVD